MARKLLDKEKKMKEETTTPKVVIIILNWNGWKDTVECLESLFRVAYPNYDVVVVDNGSSDESVNKIKAYCRGELQVNSKFFRFDSSNKPIRVFECKREHTEKEANFVEEKDSELASRRKLRLVLNEKNFGFAEGNNIGIRFALGSLNPDYVLLLNNDTVVDESFLSELVSVAESDEGIGFAGPTLYYYDFDGRTDVINFAGGRLNMLTGRSSHMGANEVDEGQYDEPREVNFVEGSCLLTRKSTLDRIGLLDSSYFAYWEENDLCMRGLKAGYKCVHVPTAKIWHKVSSAVTSTTKAYYLTRNKFWFMRRYATKSQFLSFLSYFFGYEAWYRGGAYLLFHRDKGAFGSFLRGIIDGAGGSPELTP